MTNNDRLAADRLPGADNGRATFPPLPPPAPGRPERRLRIAIASSDIVGPVRNGGIGTAYTALALALAKAGHEVTILYVLGDRTEAGPVDHWVAHYRDQGIRFVPLPRTDVPLLDSWHTAKSYETYLWLRQHEFDVVHFPEWRGHGFYSLLAKHQGLAFPNTLFCVGTHGPSLWHKEGNLEFIDHVEELEVDFMERQSVALADVLVSPSQYLLHWMTERGWRLPAHSYVCQNVLPGEARPSAEAGADGGPRRAAAVRELVFFGRLEARKGLLLFCDAVERLARMGPGELVVTFLGKPGLVAGRSAQDYLRDRVRHWPFPWQVIGDRDAAGALEYLRGQGRLAVIPSLVENSPYTVLECLGAGIPFLASAVGGNPELVADEDRNEALFVPRPAALADRLWRAVREGVRPARLEVDRDATRRAWLAWHAGLVVEPPAPPTPPDHWPLVSVCIPHYNRPAFLRQLLASVERQDYPAFEVVLVDDGSTEPAALDYLRELDSTFAARGWQLIRQENRYPGAARNLAARHARGEYLLFMDDDNYAKPHQLSTFVAVARRTGAEILTSLIDQFPGSEPPGPDQVPLRRCLPLGPAAAPGALNNCFGDVNALIRRETFLELGGFTEDFGLGHEDWEFFAKATLRGRHLEVVPEPLFWYRVSETGLNTRTPQAANFVRILRPYLDVVPEPVRDLVRCCQGLLFRLYALGKDYESACQFATNLEEHHRNVQQWCDHLEQEFGKLRGEFERLGQHYQDAKHWCGHLEAQYEILRQQRDFVQALNDRLNQERQRWRYRAVDKAVAWAHKVPFGPAVARTFVRSAKKVRRFLF